MKRRLTQEPALLAVLQLLVESGSFQNLGVVESAGPVRFCAQQQTTGVADQLTSHRVKSLLVDVWGVLAVWSFDGHLERFENRIDRNVNPKAWRQLTWTQSSTPRTPGIPATLWNSWRDCSLLDSSLFRKRSVYQCGEIHNENQTPSNRLPIEGDELRGFLHQGFGHVGNTSGHGRLADSYDVPHGGLERARRVEAKRSQDLHLRTDGSGPLRSSPESLERQNVRKHEEGGAAARKTPHLSEQLHQIQDEVSREAKMREEETVRDRIQVKAVQRFVTSTVEEEVTVQNSDGDGHDAGEKKVGLNLIKSFFFFFHNRT